MFLIAGLATLIAGVAALVGGKLRSDAQLTRYGVWAVAILVVAVLVIVVTKSLQPRAGTLLTRCLGFADGLLPAVLARWRGATRGRVSNNPPRLQDIDRSTPPGTIDSSA